MKLSLIGRGLRPWEHLTLAGLRALKDADVVLGIEPDKGAWQALTKEFSLPPIRSLDFIYRDGLCDETCHKAFQKFILDVSDFYDHIALIISGHPRFGVNLLQWITKNKLPSHIEVDVIEGVTSFDTMFNDLERDPLERGTVVLDANQLIRTRSTLNDTLDTFIYHLPSLGISNSTSFQFNRRNELNLLAEHLNSFYSKNKKITLCKAANVTGGASEYIEISLENLIDHALLIDIGTTLFIPAESVQKIKPKATENQTKRDLISII